MIILNRRANRNGAAPFQRLRPVSDDWNGFGKETGERERMMMDPADDSFSLPLPPISAVPFPTLPGSLISLSKRATRASKIGKRVGRFFLEGYQPPMRTSHGEGKLGAFGSPAHNRSLSHCPPKNIEFREFRTPRAPTRNKFFSSNRGDFSVAFSEVLAGLS